MSPPPKTKRAVFAVRGMECSTCALGIEKRLGRMEGVESVKAAVMLNEVFVDYDETKIDEERVTEEIRKAGYSNHLVKRVS